MQNGAKINGGVNEQLKAENQIELAARMDLIRFCDREIINNY